MKFQITVKRRLALQLDQMMSDLMLLLIAYTMCKNVGLTALVLMEQLTSHLLPSQDNLGEIVFANPLKVL